MQKISRIALALQILAVLALFLVAVDYASAVELAKIERLPWATSYAELCARGIDACGHAATLARWGK